MRLKDLFLNIALSGKTFENDETGINNLFIRYLLMNLALAAGFFILLFFALESFLSGSYVDAALNGGMAFLCLLSFCIARTSVAPEVPILISVLAYPFLCAGLVINGAAQGAGFVWMYMYPLMATILMGLHFGVFLSLGMIIIVALITLAPGFSNYAYETAAALRLIVAYFLVLGMTITFEVAREAKEKANLDLTRSLKAQRDEIAALKEKADAASEAKSSFLASMSHEIRTPMNAISGMSELLLRRAIDEESKGYVRDIKQASTNLLSIINDLLDFSKIEAGRLEIVPVTYYLSSLINDVVNIIRMRLVEKPIRFYTNIDAGIPNVLSGDVTRVRQILLNLLGNAVKYTEKGFISVTITQEAKGGNTVTLKIAVADSGFGIKSEDQRKLFGEFVQVDTTRNRGIEGTGLGLAITQRLCFAMGGDISVESEYGEGSVFTVLIPQEIADEGANMPFAAVDNPGEKKTLVYERRVNYAKSVAWSLENMGVPHRIATTHEDFIEALRGEDWYFVFSGYGLYEQIKPALAQLEEEFPRKKSPPLALMIEWGTEAYVPGVRFVSLPVQALSISDVLNGTPDRRNYGESAFSGTRFTAPAARLLVVDDIATNLKVAEGLIAPYHARVDTSLSGAEAIELVKRNVYDIIFMDHMMPGMDGIEAAGIIRAIEGDYFSAVPIIALTANAVSGMREMFLAQGFNDFLAKPIDVSKLDDVIGKWLPREKQIKAEGRKAPEKDAAPEPPPPAIPGVDAVNGIAMTGGTIGGYKKVLAIFRKDAEERLALLQAPPEPEALPVFVTQVHAIKSAAGTIGAAEVSAEAAALEAAGKAGDAAAIQELLPGFTEKLAVLAAGIGAALEATAPAVPEEPAAAGAELLPLLRELAEALQARKMTAVDRVLEELNRKAAETKTREALDAVSDDVLLGEYDKALETIAGLPENIPQE